MIKNRTFSPLIAGCMLLLAAGGGCRREAPRTDTRVGAKRPRIVSLAPAITEALFALSLGEHVVGVSRFCDYPPEVAAIEKVGGLTDVDVEKIVRLLPDMVIAPPAQQRARAMLEQLKIPVLTLEQDTLPQVLDSVWQIGEALDRADVAAAWLAEMETLFANVSANKPQSENPPKVMICVGRDTASVEKLYIAGQGTFYNEIIELVGARNAYEGGIPYPVVSAEGVMRMNPDIIIDIVPAGPEGPRVTPGQALKQWRSLDKVKAVGDRRVHIITESWAVRPGPRIGFLIRRIAEIAQENPAINKAP